MTKILLRKQLAEIFRTYLYDAKKNKARSKGTVIAYFVLFALLMVGLLGGMAEVPTSAPTWARARSTAARARRPSSCTEEGLPAGTPSASAAMTSARRGVVALWSRYVRASITRLSIFKEHLVHVTESLQSPPANVISALSCAARHRRKVETRLRRKLV